MQPDLAEEARLQAVDRYDILDTPREEAFDRIVRLTRRVFDMPVAMVSVIDAHRQWFKACEGFAACEASRSDTFCNLTIRGSGPLMVPDTLLDPRFERNPFVLADPSLRAYAGAPLTTPEGHNVGTLCAIDYRPRSFTASDAEMLVDLARIAMGELELRRAAETDTLTGVLSRRAFRERGDREMALARRHGHDLGCVCIDLDHFKSINDRFGHPAGDAVLTGAADCIRSMLRQTDLFGRLGGEEFAVLLPHADQARAMDVAQRIRAAIARHGHQIAGKRLTVTASLGVASFDAAAADLDALLAQADAALYEAKAAGRNRAVAAEPGSGRPAGRRVLKAGQISFAGQARAIDCTVRRLAESGAGLDVSDGAAVPNSFDLVVGTEGLRAPCRVVMRGERHLDVEFL